MRHEHRNLSIGRAALSLQGVRQRQIGRQCDDPGQPRRIAQPALQSDGATLRKAGKRDAGGSDATRDFARDQLLHRVLGLAHATFVLLQRQVLVADVVPGAHHVTAVDRHRLQRSVREHEADRQPFQSQLGNDGDEVVAVGPEPVHPDYAGGRLGRRLDLDGGQWFDGT